MSAFIKAHNAERDDQFGSPIALDGTTLAITGFHESSTDRGVNGAGTARGADQAGAVYVFE
jgi:FG-GAP repeat